MHLPEPEADSNRTTVAHCFDEACVTPLGKERASESADEFTCSNMRPWVQTFSRMHPADRLALRMCWQKN